MSVPGVVPADLVLPEADPVDRGVEIAARTSWHARHPEEFPDAGAPRAEGDMVGGRAGPANVPGWKSFSTRMWFTYTSTGVAGTPWKTDTCEIPNDRQVGWAAFAGAADTPISASTAAEITPIRHHRFLIMMNPFVSSALRAEPLVKSFPATGSIGCADHEFF